MNSLEVIDAMNMHLKGGPLAANISGSIHKVELPAGSTGENVVINTLGMTGEQLQQGEVNVNVYVPDMQVTINGIGQGQPNLSRLKILTTLAVSEATGRYAGYWFDYKWDKLFKDEASGAHYSNIRIEFYANNF